MTRYSQAWMASGITLGVGDYLISDNGQWFAGIVNGLFAVCSGTPAQPIGVSWVLAPADTFLIAPPSGPGGGPIWPGKEDLPPIKPIVPIVDHFYLFALRLDGQPSATWTGTDGPIYVVMQDDGNLVCYQGDGPESQGNMIQSSWNSGALQADLLPMPPSGTTTITVHNTANGELQVGVRYAHGERGPQVTAPPDFGNPGSNAVTWTIPAQPYGVQCWMAGYEADGHVDQSEDNFVLGEANVTYRLESANIAEGWSWTRLS